MKYKTNASIPSTDELASIRPSTEASSNVEDKKSFRYFYNCVANNLFNIRTKRLTVLFALVISTILVFQDGGTAWKDWTLIVWVVCISKGLDTLNECWRLDDNNTE